MLIRILIVFFVSLLFYQVFLAFFKNSFGIIEGLEGSSSDDPLILSKTNASDIIVLRGRVDKLDGPDLNVIVKVSDLNARVDDLKKQVDEIVNQQTEFAKSQDTDALETTSSGLE